MIRYLIALARNELGREPCDAAEKALDELEAVVDRLRAGIRESEDDRTCRGKKIAKQVDEIERMRKENGIRKRFMEGLPFCPDHRDKVSGKPCRECEIERLQAVVDKLDHTDLPPGNSRHWWPGDKRVEPYMQPVADAISRHLPRGGAWTDIYNRAYEAVFAAIKAAEAAGGDNV